MATYRAPPILELLHERIGIEFFGFKMMMDQILEPKLGGMAVGFDMVLVGIATPALLADIGLIHMPRIPATA